MVVIFCSLGKVKVCFFVYLLSCAIWDVKLSQIVVGGRGCKMEVFDFIGGMLDAFV